jgi:anti-sigma factor RsiW
MDSEMSPEEKERIQDHLISCPKCSRVVEEFSKTWNLLAKLPVPERSADLLQKIIERIDAEESKGFLRWFLDYLIFQPAPLLAGLVLLAGLFLGGEIGSSFYSSAIAPKVELKKITAGEEPFYLEAFADLSPNSLEDAYFQLSTESEGRVKS